MAAQGLPIVGEPSAPRAKLTRWLSSRSRSEPWKTWAVRRLWEESVREGLDPIGVICQACKETGYGRFDGAVPLRFHNTCGLRVDAETLQVIERTKQGASPRVRGVLHTLSHYAFPNWIIGARAHVQHLCAYLGQKPSTTIVDPRFGLLRGAPKVETWRELSGRWAVPGVNYGEQIEEMMRKVRAS